MNFFRKAKVGVLGGSFDPIHIGHLQIAIQLLNEQIVDEIYIVPCGDRLDKKLSSSGKHRLEMTKIAINEYFQEKFPIYVNDIEIQNQQAIPTYFLLTQLQKIEPQKQFLFIIGSDLLQNLKQWDCYQQMNEEFGFIILARVGYKFIEEDFPLHYQILELNQNNYSSTDIRNKIKKVREMIFYSKKQQSICQNYLNIYGIVPFGVIEYIKNNHLYGYV